MGWPCSYYLNLINDKDCIKLFVETLLKQKTQSQKDNYTNLGKALPDIPNGIIELEIKMTTWIPLVGRLLPPTKITIKKENNMVRLDCIYLYILVDVFGSNSSIIFVGSEDNVEIYNLDHEAKHYWNLWELIDTELPEVTPDMIEKLKSDTNAGGNLVTKHVKVNPAKKFFGGQKTELVAGLWDSKCYNLDNMKLVIYEQVAETTNTPGLDPNVPPPPMITDAAPAKPTTIPTKQHAELRIKKEDSFMYAVVKGGRIDLSIDSTCDSVDCIASLIPISEIENEKPKSII